MGTLIPIISLLLSCIAIGITWMIFHKTQKTAVQPVIVFSNIEKEDGDITSWCMENVGNGAALNVLVAGGNNRLEWNNGDTTLIPAIACNVIRKLDFIKQRGALLATYKDIYGREYTSVCVHNKNTITKGNTYSHLKPKKYGYQLKNKKT